MTGRLEGRVAAVVGGGSGMGRSTALRLAEEGAHVYVADLSLEAAEKVAAQIGGSASVCTWNEALCLRIGGGKSVRNAGPKTRQREAYFDFGTVTFGIDVFRLTDNLLRATEGSS